MITIDDPAIRHESGAGCTMCPSSLQVDTIASVHITSMTSDYTSVQTATNRHQRTLTSFPAPKSFLTSSRAKPNLFLSFSVFLHGAKGALTMTEASARELSR